MESKESHIFIKIKLLFAVCVIIFILGLISSYNFNNTVKAYNNNYNKGAPGDISATEWNYLNDDFVDKEGVAGDTMAGPLTLPGDPSLPLQTATKNYVDNNIYGGSTVTDRDNNVLNMICDSTNDNGLDDGILDPGTNWNNYPPLPALPAGVSTYVDTRTSGGANNFSSTPNYIVSIRGLGNHYDHSGIAIINPTPSGFTLIVRTPYRFDQAESWGWFVNWCGIGQ